MRGICSFLGALIIGWIGSKIGGLILGPGLALTLGCIGAAIGFYYTRKWVDEWLG